MGSIRARYLQAIKELPAGVTVNDLRLLLVEHLGFRNYAELDLNLDQKLTDPEKFEISFAELISGKPVQYIVKNANFYGRDYYVDERVLIPRPETEELVEHVLDYISQSKQSKPFTVVDVGTGSGVIAIEIAKRANAQIHATDISFEALEVAKKNALTHDAKIIFHHGNLLEPILNKKIAVDLIVSNPPYIYPNEKLENKVFDHEPHLALFANEGIDYHCEILRQAKKLNKEKILVFMEIGETQEQPLKDFLKNEYPYSTFKFIKDMQGKTRIIQVELLGEYHEKNNFINTK